MPKPAKSNSIIQVTGGGSVLRTKAYLTMEMETLGV